MVSKQPQYSRKSTTVLFLVGLSEPQNKIRFKGNHWLCYKAAFCVNTATTDIMQELCCTVSSGIVKHLHIYASFKKRSFKCYYTKMAGIQPSAMKDISTASKGILVKQLMPWLKKITLENKSKLLNYRFIMAHNQIAMK